jgi:DNA-binding transcriptional LysR family regulator
MFDLRLLTSFIAVAELKHFGHAATALYATQPGVSQHIAKLENQLGYKLIERTKRSVELTAAGETFLGHARLVISMLQKMKSEGQRVANGLLGEVSLGLSSSVVHSDIPARIAAFKSAVPDVKLKLLVQSGDQLKALLDYGEIDAAITTLPMMEAGYRSTVISSQSMGVALPASNPLAARRRLTIKALLNEPFIVVPRDHHPQNHDALIARFHSLGARLNVSAYESSFQNVLARVAIGEGVALVSLGYRFTRADAVRVVPLQDPHLSSTPIHSVIRHDNLKPSTERLLEALSKPGAGLGPGAAA